MLNLTTPVDLARVRLMAGRTVPAAFTALLAEAVVFGLCRRLQPLYKLTVRL